MTPSWYIPRRTILRGMGTAVALPFLEAMVAPRRTRVLAADSKIEARRFVGIFGLPSGQVGKWDPAQNSMVSPWTPDQEGMLAGPDTTGFLDPFFGKGKPLGQNVQDIRFRDVSRKLVIPTGLSDVSCGHNTNACLLGPHKPVCPEGGHCNDAPDGPDIGGPTADQRAAEYFAKTVSLPLRSLVMGAPFNAGRDVLDTYGTYLSWTSGKVHAPMDTTPGAVFDKLFDGKIDPTEDKAAAALRKQNRKSVLDVVRREAERIQNRVGKQDRDKIGLYLESIRDLEKQIAAFEGAAQCSMSAPPPEVSTYVLGDLDKRIRLFMDLIVKAFECDRTRVSSLMYHNSNGAEAWPFLGLFKEDHHACSHYNPGERTPQDEQECRDYMNKYGKWALQMLAYLMSELDGRTEVGADGSLETLLDNSLIYFGGDTGDSAAHSFASANVLVGGRGGRDPVTTRWAVNSGRHVRFSPPWDYCWGNIAHRYCYLDGTGTGTTPTTEAIRFTGEGTTKDLIWGLLKALGLPDSAITLGERTFGYATAPLDLT